MPRVRANPILVALGANLKRLRKEIGLTQDDLAGRMRADIRYVQRMERGKVDIRLSTLGKVAKALEVEPGELILKAELPEPRPGRPPKTDTQSD